ncbi:hypothetical protein PhCBS80983_g02179 [Powellomyces hirtus]|uniref:Protein KTI12 n=1 Tax=Powellomyces hirtus TaxID=109895 RepID=A0A507E8U2_9FUNG|nr:hypothetical protein PhCBS80983_g02179 [Powellomyces hirtus]
MCGTPLSGKTTRAQSLKAELETYLASYTPPPPEPPSGTTNRPSVAIPITSNVVLLNEESLGIDKAMAYESAHEEKKARGALISAVERHLSRDTIIICDSLNYIKGFRYQLYCIARALGTPSCTVYCITPHSPSSTSSSTPPPFTPYSSPSIVSELTSRFEEPDSRHRWDAPLFTLLPTDLSPTPDIITAIVTRAAPAPNLSTVVKPLTETNYLHEMDRATTAVVDAVYAAQTNNGPGKCTLPGASVQIVLPGRVVSLSELRRQRRQYALLNKHHTQLDLKKLVDGFVEYLNTNL